MSIESFRLREQQLTSELAQLNQRASQLAIAIYQCQGAIHLLREIIKADEGVNRLPDNGELVSAKE